MRVLSQNEIARSAHKRSGNTKSNSLYGNTHPNKDKNDICISCKNEDTEIITGVDLMPFNEFYGEVPFKALHCNCCGAIFSHFGVKK